MATIPKIAMIPSGYKAGKVYSVLPTNGDADLTFTRVGALPSYNATRVNQNGLIEEVLSNVPRLDYSDGGCPSLLVEPQTTNIHLRSEEFDNIYWAKNGVTVTANNAISPRGDLTMDLMTESAISEPHNLLTGVSTITPDVFQTFSVFFKKQSGSAQRYLRLDIQDTSFSNAGRALFDIETGTIALAPVNVGLATGVTSKIEDYGNGIYRASVTVNLNGGFTQCRTQTFLQNQKTSYVATYLGDGVSGVNLWGAQLSSSPYPTSDIPTVDSTVTRVEERVFKTGLTNYINSVQGGMEVECNLLGNQTDTVRFSLSNGSVNNRISLALTSTQVTIFPIIGGGPAGATINYTYAFNDYTKFKVTWNTTIMRLFVNDVEVATSPITTPFTPNLFTQFSLDTGSTTAFFYGKVKQINIYNE